MICFLCQLQDSHSQNGPLQTAIQNGRGKVQISPFVAKVAQTKLTSSLGWQHAIRQVEGFHLPWHGHLTHKTTSVNLFACLAFDHFFYWSMCIDRNFTLSVSKWPLDLFLWISTTVFSVGCLILHFEDFKIFYLKNNLIALNMSLK